MTQYFDESPTTGSAPRTVNVRVRGATFRLHTDRGVFSQAGLDTGTEILLSTAPGPPQHGHLLDLGCGTGIVALTLGCRAPRTTVWAVDVNERARALCAANAIDNEVPNVNVSAPEEVPADVRFDAIWSNPPIRIGKPALHALLQTWLMRLTLDGHAILVVHKHLGSDSLHHWLTEQGWPTDRLTSSKGYRVLRVASGAGRVDLDAQA